MAANQLAALQQEQLLQIRDLLLQEQQVLAARSLTLAIEDAMRDSATKEFYQASPINVNAASWNP
jgi:conjugal transfer/entry exclusion protein